MLSINHGTVPGEFSEPTGSSFFWDDSHIHDVRVTYTDLLILRLRHVYVIPL